MPQNDAEQYLQDRSTTDAGGTLAGGKIPVGHPEDSVVNTMRAGLQQVQKKRPADFNRLIDSGCLGADSGPQTPTTGPYLGLDRVEIKACQVTALGNLPQQVECVITAQGVTFHYRKSSATQIHMAITWDPPQKIYDGVPATLTLTGRGTQVSGSDLATEVLLQVVPGASTPGRRRRAGATPATRRRAGTPSSTTWAAPGRRRPACTA